MSVDKTLRSKAGMSRSRNVLTRVERIAELSRLGRFTAGSSSPFGLPKTRIVKVKRAKKKEKKKEEAPAAETKKA
ncbi:MAG: small basic protein [Planctomycetota bacterium]